LPDVPIILATTVQPLSVKLSGDIYSSLRVECTNKD